MTVILFFVQVYAIKNILNLFVLNLFGSLSMENVFETVRDFVNKIESRTP